VNLVSRFPFSILVFWGFFIMIQSARRSGETFVKQKAQKTEDLGKQGITCKNLLTLSKNFVYWGNVLVSGNNCNGPLVPTPAAGRDGPHPVCYSSVFLIPVSRFDPNRISCVFINLPAAPAGKKFTGQH
jgi:hypothetical protein